MPGEVKKVVETVKTGKGSAENLKGKIESEPKSIKEIKRKSKHKAIEKALELPQ